MPAPLGRNWDRQNFFGRGRSKTGSELSLSQLSKTVSKHCLTKSRVASAEPSAQKFSSNKSPRTSALCSGTALRPRSKDPLRPLARPRLLVATSVSGKRRPVGLVRVAVAAQHSAVLLYPLAERPEQEDEVPEPVATRWNADRCLDWSLQKGMQLAFAAYASLGRPIRAAGRLP